MTTLLRFEGAPLSETDVQALREQGGARPLTEKEVVWEDLKRTTIQPTPKSHVVYYSAVYNQWVYRLPNE